MKGVQGVTAGAWGREGFLSLAETRAGGRAPESLGQGLGPLTEDPLSR